MMNLFYVVWDYVDERLFDKRNTSDCAQFSELLGWPTSCKSYTSALTQTPSFYFFQDGADMPVNVGAKRECEEGGLSLD